MNDSNTTQPKRNRRIAITGAIVLSVFSMLIIMIFMGGVFYRVRGAPTLLMEAAQKGDASAVRRLLAQGVEIDERRGYSIRFGFFPVHGPSTAIYGETALLIAVAGISPDVVRTLLDAGADTTVQDSLGRGMWDYAAGNVGGQRSDVFLFLAERFPVPPRYIDEVLYHVGYIGDARLLEFALGAGGSEVARKAALCGASMRADLVMMERVLQTFAAAPPESLDCAIGAPRERRLSAVMYLLSLGVGPNGNVASRTPPLSAALLTFSPGTAAESVPGEARELFEALLSHGADPRAAPAGGMSPIALARKRGDEAAARLLESWQATDRPQLANPCPLICLKAEYAQGCFSGCAVPSSSTRPVIVDGAEVDVGLFIRGSAPGGAQGDDRRFEVTIRDWNPQGLAECSVTVDGMTFGRTTQQCEPLGPIQVTVQLQ